MDFNKLKRFGQFDTAGWIAVSSLLLCGLSGTLLAIPYDFARAYQSLFELLLFNPAGIFVRNLHYWSAQLYFYLQPAAYLGSPEQIDRIKYQGKTYLVYLMPCRGLSWL